MSTSTLSNRLKNVEDEIMSLMSFHEASPRNSAELFRTSSEGSIGTSLSSFQGCRVDCSQTKMVAGERQFTSKNSSRMSVHSNENRQPQPAGRRRTAVSLNCTKDDNSYDCLQTYLHNINDNIIKSTKAISKVTSCSELKEHNHSRSAPTSTVMCTKKFKDNMKELQDERGKRLVAERSLETLKSDLKSDRKKHQQDEWDLKNMKEKMSGLTEELQSERQKRIFVEKDLDSLKVEVKKHQSEEKKAREMNEKYTALVEELRIEQERRWELEQTAKSLRDGLDESTLKIQELTGARTMAVELAHDLEKKNRNFIREYSRTLETIKKRNAELEKQLAEAKNCNEYIQKRIDEFETLAKDYRAKESEVVYFKEKLECAENVIHDYENRDAKDFPQVRDILDAQEQSFKAALTEKATNEMALQAKYTTLEVELRLAQDDFSKRLNEVENEKQAIKGELMQKIEERNEELEKLRLVIQELTEVVSQYKARIQELADVNKHQEVLIKCQNEAISSKEERVRLTLQEGELNLRKLEQEKKDIVLEHEKTIASLSMQLEEEKDKLRVKEKIADDQTETILQLKQTISERAKDIQKRSKDQHQLEQQLGFERGEKESMACDIAHLRMMRDRNSEMVRDLQKQVDVLKSSNVHKKHTQMLEDLEKKVQIKQEEWQSEIHKLMKERDQARETAQYAIENLTTAMQEYQKELNCQTNVQQKLAALIREKEEQLNFVENKVLKSRQTMSECFRVTPSWLNTNNRYVRRRLKNSLSYQRLHDKFRLI